MTADDLVVLVGKPYHRYDEKGLASGCMAPVFFLYPELPRYDWPEDESKIGQYMESLFDMHTTKIDINEMQPGDVILVQIFFGLLHPGVFIGSGQMIHCLKETGWEIMRFSGVRVKGVYRVCRQVD